MPGSGCVSLTIERKEEDEAGNETLENMHLLSSLGREEMASVLCNFSFAPIFPGLGRRDQGWAKQSQ